MNTSEKLAKMRGRKVGRKLFPFGYYWQNFKARGYSLRGLEQEPDLRKVGTASDILKLRHNGWYTDHNYGDTMFGVVYRLANGKFLAVTEDSNGNYCLINEVYECERSAASDADGAAERMSEDEREHSLKWEAEQEVKSTRERLHESRLEAKHLIKELRTNSALPPLVCELVRGQIKDYRNKVRKAVKRIRELEDASYLYWDDNKGVCVG